MLYFEDTQNSYFFDDVITHTLMPYNF